MGHMHDMSCTSYTVYVGLTLNKRGTQTSCFAFANAASSLATVSSNELQSLASD